MPQPRRYTKPIAFLVAFGLGCAAACNTTPTGPEVGPTLVATPRPSPTPEATSVALVTGPVPTPDPQQQTFGLHAPLPLAGEFAVTANMDDHSLSVVPIGAAAVAATVPLDLAPRAVGAAPNSDIVLATDGLPSTHSVAVASLNASAESGTIDVGTVPAQGAAPAPTSVGGPLLIVSESDDTIRSADPSSQAIGAAVKLGLGPHAVSVAGGNAMLTPQVYVANAGDGTVSMLDHKVTGVQSTLKVGGRPVGVVRTIDGRLWVADGNDGTVAMFDSESGAKLQTIEVGPDLTALAGLRMDRIWCCRPARRRQRCIRRTW